jgi:predicted metal-dependent hydrolase
MSESDAERPLRLCRRPLPAYRFLPGASPHPTRDVKGHSAGAPTEALEVWRPEDWRRLEEWLWALDLFNYEYWWESHEALESLWHAAGRSSSAAKFVQSLIHLSAACLNRRRGHERASRRQAARAVRGLREARSMGPVVMGIDVDKLARDIVRSFESAEPTRILIEPDTEGS